MTFAHFFGALVIQVILAVLGRMMPKIDVVFLILLGLVYFTQVAFYILDLHEYFKIDGTAITKDVADEKEFIAFLKVSFYFLLTMICIFYFLLCCGLLTYNAGQRART